MNYHSSLFLDHLNEPLSLQLDNGEKLDLTIAEVTLSPNSYRSASDRESFSVLLVDNQHHQEHLPQGIYPFTHEVIGALELFIVPLGYSAQHQGMAYELVFS